MGNQLCNANKSKPGKYDSTTTTTSFPGLASTPIESKLGQSDPTTIATNNPGLTSTPIQSNVGQYNPTTTATNYPGLTSTPIQSKLGQYDPTTTAINLPELTPTSINISLNLQYNTLRLNSASDSIVPICFSLQHMGESNLRIRVPIDLVCVLDRSGSMAGEKLEELKRSMYHLVNHMHEQDRLAIVVFDHSAEIRMDLVYATPINRTRIDAGIESLEASGGTEITSGIREALNLLDRRQTKNPITSIFLLSDGEDSGALRGVQSLVQNRQIDQNLTMYTFGYGLDHDPVMMNNLAKIGNGHFYLVEEPHMADECFVDALGGLFSAVGEACTISIQPTPSDVFPNGVRITQGYGGDSIWKVNVGGVYSAQFAHLPSGKSRNFVVGLLIPKCTKTLTDQQKDVVLAKASMSIRNLVTKEVITMNSELKVHLINENEEWNQQMVNKQVLINYYRLRVAEVMQQAKNHANSYNHDAGIKIMIALKQEIENSVVKDEEQIKSLLADIQITINELDPGSFRRVGQHRMEMQIESHLHEKSNPSSNVGANIYANNVQKELVAIARAKKPNRY